VGFTPYVLGGGPLYQLLGGYLLDTGHIDKLQGEPGDRVAVCSDCEVISRPKRKSHARRCKRCNSNSPPPQRRPGDLAWFCEPIHDATTGEVVEYREWRRFDCGRCGRAVVDIRGRAGGQPRKRCHTCRGETGPFQFRLAYSSTDDAFAGSCARPDGTTISLQATRGVVEVEDAEDALGILDMVDLLRRVSPPRR